MITIPRDCSIVGLAAGGLSATVAPGCGARLASLRLARSGATVDLLRPATPAALADGDAYGFCGFPLVPYSGPIFGGGFAWGGGFHKLARNYPGEPVATHGEGWISPWSIEAAAPDRLTLGFDHRPAEGRFPFAYRARLDYRLDARGLSIDLALINRDHRPMPAGIGFHPYFPRHPTTRLAFEATGCWPPDAPETVQLGCQPLPPALDFAAGQPVDACVIDRCFEGWDGVALIEQPADGISLRLTADASFGKLQIYSPWGYPYVCVEPVSNANDGFNRAAIGVAGHGVVALEPGRRLAGGLRIELA
jgi:aldose 1-epimerase